VLVCRGCCCGTETFWLGRILRAGDTALLASWLARGGPVPTPLRGRLLAAGEAREAEPWPA
jgi:hypothetical protein